MHTLLQKVDVWIHLLGCPTGGGGDAQGGGGDETKPNEEGKREKK